MSNYDAVLALLWHLKVLTWYICYAVTALKFSAILGEMNKPGEVFDSGD
jgi:hypothetical protein